jgi:hypothetical protein
VGRITTPHLEVEVLMSTLSSAQLATLVTRTKLVANISGSDEDTLLEILIEDLWAKMENHLDRDVLSTSKDEILSIGEDGIGILADPDVTGIDFVGASFENALTVEYTGSNLSPTVEVTDVSVILREVASDGTTTTTTKTFASSASVTALATAIDGTTGWTGTLVNNGDSTMLERRGVRALVSGGQLTLDRWAEYDGYYETNYRVGYIDFYGSDGSDISTMRGYPYHDIRVKYTAGFSTIPADVEYEIIFAAKAAWNLKDKDLAVKSEKLGDYSYALSAQVTFSPSSRLSRYTRISL